MDLIHPLTSIAPGLDSAALGVLAVADTALSATQIQRLARRGSRYGLVLVLERLVEHGLVVADPGPRGRMYRLNRDHVLAPALLTIAQAWAQVEERFNTAFSELRPRPLSAAIYGSVARGSSTPASDIDLLIIAANNTDPEGQDWAEQIAIIEDLGFKWTGNRVQAVTVTQDLLATMATADEAIVAEWERDARTIFGRDARRLIRGTRRQHR